MVNEVKKRTGWEKIGYIQLIGNYSKGRECKATSGNESYSYYFRTYGDGRMMAFQDR